VISHSLFAAAAGIGLVLVVWTLLVFPQAGDLAPEDRPPRWLSAGPYGLLAHPLYVGTWLLVTGSAGLASGWWNALSVGTVTELVLRDWARREG
jgi:protein-S-isoprenylcysteine O-methyltransferase Ste14